MLLLILFFLLSVIVSFLCSIWEAALLSIPPSYVEIQEQEGTSYGRLLKKMKSDIDRPLSAILTLNTIAHTVGAIGVGAQATKIWKEEALTLPFSASWAFSVSVAAVMVPTVMTLAILILSEIIPKTLGASYWKRLAPFTVRGLQVITYGLWPLVWLSQWITRLLKTEEGKSVLSRTDFHAMTKIGEREGIFYPGESTIIKNLLRFHAVTAQDIMTPRTVVVAASQDQTILSFYETHHELRFSRIPIFDESKDHITGFALKDEILECLVHDDGNKKMKEIKREIMVVHETQSINDLFNRFVESREQIALVVDEYGGMAGIVTMEDVIETLLGMEIVDELDSTVNMQQLARKNWEKRARLLGIVEEGDEFPSKQTSKGEG